MVFGASQRFGMFNVLEERDLRVAGSPARHGDGIEVAGAWLCRPATAHLALRNACFSRQCDYITGASYANDVIM